MSGLIWSKIELDQAFIPVLVTSNFADDLIKNEQASITLEPKLLYLPQKRLEVTSSAIVVLTAFLDNPNLPKEGLSVLKGNFSWPNT